MAKIILLVLSWLFCPLTYASNILNVYVWGGEIPAELIKRFEKTTKIKVNFSTYDSNEVLFAKLKTSQDYDIIMPSSYMVEKLVKNNRLLSLDYSKLNQTNNLHPFFTSDDFKKLNQYAIPITWGATGVFYNKKYHKAPPKHWQQLWSTKYRNKVMLLDDAREVFAMALIELGFPVNSEDPEKLKQAYQKLLLLQPNVKLLSTNTIPGLMIDEDVTLGMAWNGDVYKANFENPNIGFVLPQKGFALWVDCLAILKTAPNKKNAYAFLNFMLNPESGKLIMKKEGMPSTNPKSYALLNKNHHLNYLIEPKMNTLQKGQLIKNLSPKANKILFKYWQQFKLSF